MRKSFYILLLLLLSLPAEAKYWIPGQYEDSVRAAFRSNRWDYARQLLDEAEPLYGTMSTMCCLNGRYYYHFTQYDEARRYLLMALRDDDSNVEAIELLVRVERETGHYSTAIAHTNHWLEFAPYDVGVWMQQIELYRMAGNDIEADRLLERLYTIYPNDTTVRRAMSYQYEMRYYDHHRAGNTAAEEEALRQILRVDPTNKEANRALNDLERKRMDRIMERERRNAARERRYEDSLNVQRTAKLSATLVMDAIHGDERDRKADPDVMAARMLQEASSMVGDGQYREALAILDVVDTLATSPDLLEAAARRRQTCNALLAEREQRRFVGDAIDTSYALIRRKRAAEALPLLDSVLVIDPKHNEAHYVHSLADEKLKHYDTAYYHLSKYEPAPSEVFMVRRRLHSLAFRMHRNTLNFEYQYARRSSLDELTHNAYVDYTHSWSHDLLGVHVGYAGREQGSAVQLGANWTHYFVAVPLAIDIHGSWANQFFPMATGGIHFTEELPHEWSLMEKLDYRRVLNDEDNYHLLSLGLSTTKQIDRFAITPAFDTYLMLSNTSDGLKPAVYFNGSLKMQYAFLEGDRSNFFAAVGVGNAPESTLIQNSIRVEFARLNTFVSGGINWVVTDNMQAGFSTSWYALGQQDAVQKNVRNYLYINANILISF